MRAATAGCLVAALFLLGTGVHGRHLEAAEALQRRHRSCSPTQASACYSPSPSLCESMLKGRGAHVNRVDL